MTHRILHCLRAPVGGLFRHVRDLAAAQTARGHQVAVVCDSVTGDGLTAARIDALRSSARLGLHQLAMSREIGWRDAVAFAHTRDLVLDLGIGVIHGHGAKGGAYARLAANALRRQAEPPRCFYTPHGGSLHYDPRSLKGRLYLGLERRLAPMTDGIIFESAYSARTFASKVGETSARSLVIHNGLLPSEFAPHAPSADAAELLFVGELRRLKGVDVLLAALAEVHRQRPARLNIVGDGPDAAAFREQARALGLDPHVRFLGAKGPPLFADGRCLIVPSRAESLPYVVLEAAAAGVPLIASDVGGIPEIVEDSDVALVPPGDVDALARAILNVLADPDAALARARRLAASVKRRFHVDVMADRILDLYDETARAGRRR